MTPDPDWATVLLYKTNSRNMKNKLTLLFSTLLITVMSAASLAGSSDSAQFAKEIGWMNSQFNDDDVYERSTKHILDEIVGPLVKAGVKSHDMVWLKPTYGNQNILYFSQSKSFANEEINIIRLNSPKAVPPWTINEGIKTFEKIKYRFIKTSMPNSPFSQALYVCHGEKSHLIYYWGTEGNRHKSDLSELLKLISKRCH